MEKGAKIEGRGRVRVWWWRKACGFIIPDCGGPDILFGVAAFPGLRNLVASGEEVRYVAHETDKGLRAVEIEPVTPGPCPCCGAVRSK
jgi:cold shock CspA family protein